MDQLGGIFSTGSLCVMSQFFFVSLAVMLHCINLEASIRAE